MVHERGNDSIAELAVVVKSEVVWRYHLTMWWTKTPWTLRERIMNHHDAGPTAQEGSALLCIAHTPIRVREKNPNFLRWCLIIKSHKTWIYSVFCRILCNFSVRMLFWFAIFHQFSGNIAQNGLISGKSRFNLKLKAMASQLQLNLKLAINWFKFNSSAISDQIQFHSHLSHVQHNNVVKTQFHWVLGL